MWKDKYFNEDRFRDSYADRDRNNKSGLKKNDPRLACESDFGRVVFSSSCRRLHDKTQVFPLTNDDNLHSRLTHSMEVMNVGLSFALRLSKNENFCKITGLKEWEVYRYLSAYLKTAGLVHDIGNPPFGHFGEESIKAYFSNLFNEIEFELEDNEEETIYNNPIINHIIRDCDGNLIENIDERKNKIDELKALLKSPTSLDYTQFDGNAQGFRVLTKLQFLDDLCGLNLTYSSLAATLKYPNTGSKEKTPVHKHKHGVFTTEKKYLDKIAEKCGMKTEEGEIIRHPLSYLMEAADSICYMTMDVEDGCSKRSWISFEDIQKEFSEVSAEIKELFPFLDLGGDRLRGQRFKKVVVEMRTQLLAYFIDKTIDNFVSNIEKIENGTYIGNEQEEGELVYDDPQKVGQHMKEITKTFVLSQREIHSLEIAGDAILKGIMDCLIGLLFNNRKQYRIRGKNFISRSIFLTTLQEHYIDKIVSASDNDQIYYKEIANPTIKAEEQYDNFDVYDLSVEERLRIIRDFVAGMTDKFALNFYQKLSGQRVS